MNNWIRVTKDMPCPVCGHGDWCMVSKDGMAAICPRIESDLPLGESGFLHKLNKPISTKFVINRQPVRLEHKIDWGDMEAEAYKLRKDTMSLEVVRDRLGMSYVTETTLHRMGVGLIGDALSFPMRDGNGDICGIKLRRRNNSKLCVRGSRLGLYGITNMDYSGLAIVMPEGETDTIALLELGYNAIGRPNCSAGAQTITDFCLKHKPAEIVLIADNDANDAGVDGAIRLARKIRSVASIKIIVPPGNINDVREWVDKGLNKELLNYMIRSARYE